MGILQVVITLSYLLEVREVKIMIIKGNLNVKIGKEQESEIDGKYRLELHKCCGGKMHLLMDNNDVLTKTCFEEH